MADVYCCLGPRGGKKPGLALQPSLNCKSLRNIQRVKDPKSSRESSLKLILERGSVFLAGYWARPIAWNSRLLQYKKPKKKKGRARVKLTVILLITILQKYSEI